jgi:NAD-dependent deacetylase
VLRPAVVLFEEMLQESALTALKQQVQVGFDAVLVVGTTASFGYILEPVWRVRQAGGSVVEVNLQPTDISPFADVRLEGRAVDVLSHLIRHISSD